MRWYPYVVVLLALMLLPPALAAEDRARELFSASSVTMEVQLSGSLDLLPDSPGAAVDYVTVNFTFLPQDTEQQRVSGLVHSSLPRKEHDDWTFYRWDVPGEHIDYGLTATVQASEYIPPVKNEIPFPVLVLPAEVRVFTEQTEMMDSESKTIRAMAAELAEGESELYEVVFKIAEWVDQSIEYDLNTLTADVTQSASWVLKNRYGVCDEITTLFIALLRSIGIPARYVSGLAYTNYKEKNTWGPHGWSEVFFPNVGWIPFDVTYSEFGYVDPTHIVLKYSADSSEAAVRYEWLGTGITLEPDQIVVTAALKSNTGSAPPRVSLDIVPYRNTVGFGSSNLLIGMVTNLRDYTLVADVHLIPVVGMETGDKLVRYVLLKPEETKSVFWTVTTALDQKPGYIYTYPLSFSSGSTTVKSNFTVKDSAQALTLEQVTDARDAREEEEEKTYTREVLLDCEVTPEYPYLYLEPALHCTVRNAGNTLLPGLEMCLGSECTIKDLGIAESHEMTLSLSSYDAGQQFVDVKVSHPLVSRLKVQEVELLDAPAVGFKELTAPATVQYGESFTIDLTLQRTSYSVPEDLSITLFGEVVVTTENLEGEQQHRITMDSMLLKSGKNTLTIGVDFRDALDMRYSIEQSIEVSIEGAPFLVKLEAFIANLLDKIASIFT